MSNCRNPFTKYFDQWTTREADQFLETSLEVVIVTIMISKQNENGGRGWLLFTCFGRVLILFILYYMRCRKTGMDKRCINVFWREGV